MENKKREIAKFYEQIFSDTKLKEKLEEKAKAIVNEEDLKKLIQQEIVPLMKKYNVNFSEEELLEYEEETLKKLSKEDLDSVSGGTLIKPVAIGALSALALACGVGVASLSASADSGKGVLVQNAGNGQQQSDGNEEEEEEEANISENDNDEAHQIIASGNCGLEGDEESIRWEFRKDGTITIVDDGLIKDYSLSKLRPWSKISRTSDLKISDGPFVHSQFKWPSINDNAEAYQIIASGNCGPEGNEESVRWEVWKNGTLEIWGIGSMKDFSPTDPPPWRLHKDKIRHINIMTTNIGSYAFTGCSEVTSVYISPDVTSIGKYAFANCTKLNHVFFKGKKDLDPNNDKKIFANCPIEEANVTVDYTGGNAFCGIFAAPLPYYSNMYDGSAQVPKIVVTSTGDYKVLPEVSPYEIMPSDETLPPDYKEEINETDNSDIRLLQVIEVGNCGPEGNEESVRWEVWENGTFIISGFGPMKDFSPTDPPPWRLHKDKIRNITMVGTTHIGSYAFTGCSEVTSVFISGKVTSTGKYAFANCTKLNYVFFEGKKDLDPNNDKKIFANCPIEEANVTVDYTGGNAFCGQKVKFFHMPIMPMPIPDWKIKISDEPFGMPYKDLDPNNDKKIFANCPIEEVTVTNDYMGGNTFHIPIMPMPISDLRMAADPFGVPLKVSPTKMPLDKIIAGDLESEGVSWVLRKSGKLEIFGHGLMKNYSDKERPKWEQYKDKIKRVVISGVKSIGDNAFANYNELRLLEISNDVVSIGKNAFNDCNNLSVSVVIPVSVTSIGENAFANCTKLNYVFFEGKNDLDPNNDKKVFANCPIEKIKVTDAYIDGNTFCGKRAIKMKSEADMY